MTTAATKSGTCSHGGAVGGGGTTTSSTSTSTSMEQQQSWLWKRKIRYDGTCYDSHCTFDHLFIIFFE